MPSGKGPVFKKQWKILVDIIYTKENVHDNLFEQLSILCDLYQEYHDLSKFIKENGYSYESETRNGNQVKKYPEVDQRNKVLSDIRMFSKMLGITAEGKYVPEDDNNEWT
jgi:phage terminase small subunit